MAETLPKRDFKNTYTIERAHTSAVTEGEVLDFSLESGELVAAAKTEDADVLAVYYRKGEFSIDLDSAITVSQGDKIYFNATTGKATTVANGNKFLGTTSEAQATAAGFVKFFLNEKAEDIATTVSGLISGPVRVKAVPVVAATHLDTTAVDFVQMQAGDVIVKWESTIGVAAGAACVVDLGSDADLDGTAADADAFGIDIDANSAVFDSSLLAGSTGADLVGSPFTCVGTGYLTVTSSTDQSATAAAGTIYIFYIPAGV